MMTKITSAAYVAAGKALLGQARKQTIPYVAAGMSLAGMDCQGLAEYLLMECGVPKAECNLAGSNAHWRNCVWTGTPEQCKAAFGAVPPGAWVFIVSDDDGTPEKYRGDGLGDAGHMGVYLGDCAIHASSSRGYVTESKFEGKTIKNGGWNRIGLPPWVDYGEHINAVLAAIGDVGDAEGGAEGAESEGLTAGTPVQQAATYATVVSPDGNPVKLRKSASLKDSDYWKVNPGARVQVERVKGDWSLITAICTDGYQRRAYMMSRFLRG